MAALLVGSAILLAVLHWLRIRPQTVWVNTTLFWNQALRRTRARSLWERFRHPLTYLLLLLIACLLVVALAGPRPSRDSKKQEHTVYVLDLNSSMSTASPDGTTRLDLAKQKLSELIDQSAWPEKIAVVTAGPEPRLIHAMGDLRPMIEHRLESVQAATVPTNREHAVQLAEALLDGRKNPRICLITDRPLKDADEKKSEEESDEEKTKKTEQGPPCQVVQVGEPVSNAAILSAIFEPDVKNPLIGTLRVRAGVWPEGKATVKLIVRREGGLLLAEKEETFTAAKAKDSKETAEGEEDAASTIELAVDQLDADGGTVVVEITGDDALRADSVVLYQLPVRRPIRLLVDGDVPEWLSILMKLDPTLTQAKSSDADVKLCATASEPLPEPALVVEVRADASQENEASRAAMEDQPVAFEDLYCAAGIPRDHFDATVTPLVAAGDHLLLASQPDAACPTLWLADVAWKNDGTVPRSPAWPFVVSREIRRLTGWEISPMSLDPTVVEEMPELGAQRLTTIPASRETSDLTAVEKTESEATTASFFATGNAWVEWLLLLAFILVIVEIVLHTRGRIA